MKYVLIVCLPLLLLTCRPDQGGSITVESAIEGVDSLIITDAITERVLARVAVGSPSPVGVDSMTVALLRAGLGKLARLAILQPHKGKAIRISADSTVRTGNVADSLLNYLQGSTNTFLSENGGFIFSSGEPEELLDLFENFRLQRKEAIERCADRLSVEEQALLHYQNDARIHSFLFYYGRIIKSLPPDDPFFRFIDEVPNNSRWAKSLPQNVLYKHEVNYLRTRGKLRDMEDFLDYIGTQTTNRDLFAYLKAIYLRELVESPSYWAPHQELFSTEALKAAMQAERSNPYIGIIEQVSENYFASRSGMEAFNFSAKRKDGTVLRLADLRGKVVFIDNWASWCGPCIRQRPDVLALAERYRNDPRVEVLMISVDASPEDWLAFLTEQGQLDEEGDLIIENGMRTAYGDHYNIKSIPRYMLIGPEGRIIDADLGEPSQAVVDLIDSMLQPL